jgi:hypothetical protein
VAGPPEVQAIRDLGKTFGFGLANLTVFFWCRAATNKKTTAEKKIPRINPVQSV